MTSVRALELFDEIADLDARERDARLADVAQNDALLAAAVRRMLAADARAHGLLDGVLADAVPAPAMPPDRSGQRVGEYRLIERIGRGGMGEVYRAERDGEGYAQTVAIKLLRRGVDSEDIVKRFVQERRILARLEHPGIARLIDGGMSAEGVPWIAMELVDGTPITAYANTARADLRARVGLVIAVCDAVDYAHRRLVVHRDLKPSNVLVGSDGAPRLLDFGIAKLLDQPDGENLTGTGMRVLSPAYAAPEQLAGEPIGISTDVYALGLLLYELLTGDLPHGRRAGGIPQLSQETTREPERPSDSVRRGQGADSTTTARALTGDVDTIVLKALAYEPDRRYASAAALADDLRRYLDGRPIAARPDTLGYRVGKFVRRHRGGVAFGAMAASAIVAALVIALWQGSVARREAARAEREAAAAQASGARTKRVKDFMMETFVHADPRRSRTDGPKTVDAAVDDALARVDSDLADDPTLQIDVLDDFGEIRSGQGRFDDARVLFQRALALAEKTYGGAHPAVAESLINLGSLSFFVGDVPAAEPYIVRALAILDVPDAPDPLALVNPLGGMSAIRQFQGRQDESLVLSARALEIQRRYGKPDDPQLGLALHNHGTQLAERNRAAEGVLLLREAVSMGERQLGADNPGLDPMLTSLSYALYRQGKMEESFAINERRLAIARKAYPDANAWKADILTDMGWQRDETGHYAEGVAMLEEAIAIYTTLGATNEMLPALRYLALAQRNQKDHAAAMATFDRGWKLCGGLGKTLNCALLRANRAGVMAEHGDAVVALAESEAAMVDMRAHERENQSEYGQALESHAMALAALDRRDEAIAEQEKALAIYVTAFGEKHDETSRLRNRLAAMRAKK